MAGNYPDVPSWRLPYDRDGTLALRSEDNVTYDSSGVNMAALNDESSGYGFSGFGGQDVDYMVLVFPRLMDLDAYMAQGYSWAHTPQLLWSPDTTTGADGTWTTVKGMTELNTDSSSKEAMREAIQGLALTGVRAIKISMRAGPGGDGGLRTLHLFGEPTAGENTDKLQIVQVGSEDRVLPAHFDFGDKPRTTQTLKQYRVKNLSASLTAHDVVVSVEVPTDSTPSFDGMHAVSADQSTYLAQVNIGSLAPGAVSTTMDLRQVLDASAVLGLRWMRLLAVAGSWT